MSSVRAKRACTKELMEMKRNDNTRVSDMDREINKNFEE